MNYFRKWWRFLLALQLLPALESGEEETLVGGQAVLEGVMMRSPVHTKTKPTIATSPAKAKASPATAIKRVSSKP